MANLIHYTREELAKTLNPPFFLEEDYEEFHGVLIPLYDNGDFYLHLDVAPNSTEAYGSFRKYSYKNQSAIYWNAPPAPTSQYGLVLSHRIYYDDGSRNITLFRLNLLEERHLWYGLIELLVTSQRKAIALSDGKKYDRALFLQSDNSFVELSGLTFSN